MECKTYGLILCPLKELDFCVSTHFVVCKATVYIYNTAMLDLMVKHK